MYSYLCDCQYSIRDAGTGGDGHGRSASSLITAGSAAAGTAAGAGTSGAGNSGRLTAAVPGQGNAGRHDSPGAVMATGAGSIFVRLAEWPH